MTYGLLGDYDSAVLNLWVVAMLPLDTYVPYRIDEATERRAHEALSAMGLSISDAVHLLMLFVADERCLPFDIKTPNEETREAMAELEAGKGKSFDSIEALMADLNADD